MKEGIHPEYFDATVTCAGCGASYALGSVQKELNIGVCSQCHPFYTGKSKVLDTEGRVDQFQRKFGNFLENRKKKKSGEGEASKGA